MKTRRFMYLLLFVCFGFACTNDEMNIPEVSEQKAEVKEEISLKEAKDLLKDFIGEAYSRSANSFKIKSHRIRTVHVNNIGGLPSNTKEAIPVYEFVTETDGKEGYSVVVSDERVDKVLISVPYGSLADTTFIEPLRLYYQDIPLLIEQDLEQYNRGTQETATLSRMTVEYISCFTPTTWGQGYPYNAECPNQYPAGCVPIAIAQILAYHRVPSNLNWTSILASATVDSTSNASIISQVSSLVHEIGVRANTEYASGESPTNKENAAPVLTSYGLLHGGLRTFSIFESKLSLQNNRPIIMRGNTSSEGHMWVCDGWKSHIYDDNTYYDYLNMNWGWNGNSNGYFYIEEPMSFNVAGLLFNRNFQMICNIRKQ